MARWLAACALVFVGVGCGGDGTDDTPGGDALKIASFEFTESELVAELYAQLLDDAGVPVERVGPVGPREIVAPALQQGVIDLVPEYLGTAATHYGAEQPDEAGLTDALGPLDLVALTPAEAEDVNVVVVNASTARDLQLETISDLAPIASLMSFGGPVECPERPLCLIGLRETYGLEFADFVPQRSLSVTAEALRRDEIDAGMLFSTAAELARDEFAVLVDDRGLQPPENLVPIVGRDAFERWGDRIVPPLDELASTLTTASLRAMNARVNGGRPVAEVAASWLDGVGLLEP